MVKELGVIGRNTSQIPHKGWELFLFYFYSYDFRVWSGLWYDGTSPDLRCLSSEKFFREILLTTKGKEKKKSVFFDIRQHLYAREHRTPALAANLHTKLFKYYLLLQKKLFYTKVEKAVCFPSHCHGEMSRGRLQQKGS